MPDLYLNAGMSRREGRHEGSPDLSGIARRRSLLLNAPGAQRLFLVLHDIGIDGLEELGQILVVQIAGIQIHGIPSGLHHRQDAQRGLGINAELLRAQVQFVGIVLADAAQMFGRLHGINMDVNGHRNISFRGAQPYGSL